MKKIIFIVFVVIYSCSSNKDEISISGKISGLNNSKIYLIDVGEDIVLDSSKVVNEKIDLIAYINEPRELALRIESKNSNKSFKFFSEPSKKLIFTSSKEKFEFNGKIENSKMNSEYDKLKIQINKYDEKDLELLAEQIKFSVDGDQKNYDLIDEKRTKINQNKILLIVNYSINNNASPLSAFIAFKYKEKINKKYLEKIYENFSDELKGSYYAKKLISNP